MLLNGAAQAAMDEFEASGGRLPHGAQSASASERARPVALRSSRSGWHQLYVEIGGRPIHGCPFDILVSPAATDPTRCEVTLDPPQSPLAPTSSSVPQAQASPQPSHADGIAAPLLAGQPLRLRMRARDRFGNARGNGGDAVRVLLRTPRRVIDADVSDRSDGAYLCVVTPTDAGESELSVVINGKGIELSRALAAARAPAALPVEGRALPLSLKLPGTARVHVRHAALSNLSLHVIATAGLMTYEGQTSCRERPRSDSVHVAAMGSELRIAVTATDSFGNPGSASEHLMSLLAAVARYVETSEEEAVEVLPMSSATPMAVAVAVPCVELRLTPKREGRLQLAVRLGGVSEATCQVAVVDARIGAFI